MLELMKYDEMMEKQEELTSEYDTLKMFKIGPLADLTIDILNEYSTEEKIHNANQVADLVVFLLKERNLLTEGVQQSFVDLLLSSCMLYNIVDVKEKNWNDVYHIRNIVMEKAEGGNIPLQALETICDTIEGQLGEKMPIKGSRPNPNTPGELFALAVAIINKYNK